MIEAPIESSGDAIDRLAGGLRPVKPFRTWQAWTAGLVFLAGAALFIYCAYGPRMEIAALQKGVWLGNSMAVVKPLMFLVCGLSALWGVAGLARPEGRPRLSYVVPVMLVAGVIVGNLMSEVARNGLGDIAENLNGGVSTCFSTILVGGLIGLALLWAVWLRRAATSHPWALGAMSGLAVASLAASAYALHCNMDAPVYIFAIYCVAIGLFTGLAALLGRRLLTW